MTFKKKFSEIVAEVDCFSAVYVCFCFKESQFSQVTCPNFLSFLV